MSKLFENENNQSVNFGHVSLLAFLSHLAEICRKIHPKTLPCIKESDFEITFKEEAQMYFRTDCPAYTHYKYIFGKKKTLPIVDRIDYLEPWLVVPLPKVISPMELSQQYIETSAAQLADYLTQEFENPLVLFEYKHPREVELEMVVSGFIKMTENVCFYMPKLLLSIKESGSEIEQEKLAIFNGDIDKEVFCARMKGELETLRTCRAQVSKSLSAVQSGDYLMRNLGVWATSNPTLWHVQLSIKERCDRLSQIQCFIDLPKLEALCLLFRDKCKELIHMTEIVNFEESSTEGSWTADLNIHSEEEQVSHSYSSSESETALDSASHCYK